MSQDRERLLAELEAQAELRRDAQASEREALQSIARLLPDALAAGISKREISRRTGLSRVWIDELLRRQETDQAT